MSMKFRIQEYLFRMFDIYGLDQVSMYENQIIGTLPPHLFAIGKHQIQFSDQKTGWVSVVLKYGGLETYYYMKNLKIFRNFKSINANVDL